MIPGRSPEKEVSAFRKSGHDLLRVERHCDGTGRNTNPGTSLCRTGSAGCCVGCWVLGAGPGAVNRAAAGESKALPQGRLFRSPLKKRYRGTLAYRPYLIYNKHNTIIAAVHRKILKPGLQGGDIIHDGTGENEGRADRVRPD